MATFPTTEAEVAALADEMIVGFTANPLVYPAPTVAVLDLTAAKTAFTTAMNAAVAAKAAAEAAVEMAQAVRETCTPEESVDLLLLPGLEECDLGE